MQNPTPPKKIYIYIYIYIYIRSIVTSSDNGILQFGLLNYWTLHILQYCNQTTFLKLYICRDIKRWGGTYTPSYIHYKKLVSVTDHCNLTSSIHLPVSLTTESMPLHYCTKKQQQQTNKQTNKQNADCEMSSVCSPSVDLG